MAPPPCKRLGRHCRALDVTLRAAALEGQEDHDATWFYGHTQRVDFGRSFIDDDELWCESTVHVPCRHLRLGEDGVSATCGAWGYTGRIPAIRRTPAPRRLGRDRFRIVEKRKLVTRHIPPPPPPKPKRALPLAPTTNGNPCATGTCSTSDGTKKAACCRDLNVDIRCTTKQPLLEALLRNRKSPYLCKVDRENPDDQVVSAEIISACGFLQEDGIHCDLHGRVRADGRPAKPEMCSHWPEKRTGLHNGCVFKSRKIPL